MASLDDKPPVVTGKIIPVAIEDEVRTDYLTYAMLGRIPAQGQFSLQAKMP